MITPRDKPLYMDRRAEKGFYYLGTLPAVRIGDPDDDVYLIGPAHAPSSVYLYRMGPYNEGNGWLRLHDGRVVMSYRPGSNEKRIKADIIPLDPVAGDIYQPALDHPTIGPQLRAWGYS